MTPDSRADTILATIQRQAIAFRRSLVDVFNVRRITFQDSDFVSSCILTPVASATLAGLGKILASLGQADFKIQRALNFDGGSSSAFWFKRAKDGGAFSIAESKYVRDFVAVIPR